MQVEQATRRARGVQYVEPIFFRAPEGTQAALEKAAAEKDTTPTQLVRAFVLKALERAQ